MTDNLAELQVGEAFGRYELLIPVARGGMSRVWAARLRGTRGFQKLVAIKTLVADSDEARRLEPMLLAEARLAAQIQHPNVAQYLDLGERDGVLYVVMEWVDGESLTQLIKAASSRGKIPLSIAAQIVAQACNGLHGAHELHDTEGDSLGLVHCDVSPHNLMISSTGAVKVIDFGIAKARAGSPMAGQDGLVAGKFAFMSPEQARGGAVDRRADIFSLGVTLYLLTTGRHPFGSGTPAETLQRIARNSPVIPPCAADPSYPRALEQVVMRALEHDPTRRFDTAADMLYELGAAVGLAHELEVGDYLRDVCADSLSQRRARVNQAIEAATLREEHSVPPVLPSLPITLPPEPAPTSGIPGTPSAFTAAPAASDIDFEELLAPRRRWRKLLWFAAAGCAALAAFAYRAPLAALLGAPFEEPNGAFAASSALQPAAARQPPSAVAAAPAPAPVPASAPVPAAPVNEPAPAASAQPAVTPSAPARKRAVNGRACPPGGCRGKAGEARIVEHYGI